MKKLVITGCILLTALYAKSQQQPPLAEVTNWKLTAAVLTPRWWPHVKDKVKDQLTPEDFNRLATYNPWESKPPQMSWHHSVYLAKGDSAGFIRKMNELKCYLIASYTNTLDSTKRSDQVILKIPYEENRHWNDSVKWDVVYVVVPGEYVRMK